MRSDKYTAAGDSSVQPQKTSKEILEEMEAFFKAGGEVNEIETGKSSIKEKKGRGAAWKNPQN